LLWLSILALLVKAAAGWGSWSLVLTGWAGTLAVLPLLRRAARSLRPPRWPWPAVPLAHLPLAMLFAGGQAAICVALLKLGDVQIEPGMVMREVRTDILIYAAGTVLLLWRGDRDRIS
jgi:hypothetical protein